MTSIPFIPKRKIFYAISLGLVIVSLLAIIIWGFKWGIDFTGGSRWQINFIKQKPALAELNDFFKSQGFTETVIDMASGNNVIIRFKSITEEEHQKLLSALKEKFQELEEKNFSSIGPTIGQELKRRALWAVFLVTLGILLYISFAFRKISYRIPSYKYGAVAVLALFHDVLVMLGFFALIGYFGNVEINSYLVVAILIVMGYSVHDSIVVLDRIRENFRLQQGKFEIASIVNQSINETLARSINTSLTSILALLGLYLWGPLAISNLVLAMMVGIFIGTYSSIFVASPLIVDWKSKK